MVTIVYVIICNRVDLSFTSNKCFIFILYMYYLKEKKMMINPSEQ